MGQLIGAQVEFAISQAAVLKNQGHRIGRIFGLPLEGMVKALFSADGLLCGVPLALLLQLFGG